MSKKHALLVIMFCLLITDTFLFFLDFKHSQKLLTFAMLDVGQGDALYIESPSGAQILFDAGPSRKILNPLKKVISPFDRTIDAIVITNPDADHIGGVADILKNYKVGYVFEPGTQNKSKTFQNLNAEIKNKKIPKILARRGMRLDMGKGVIVEILFPDRNVSTWSTNDGSVVARLVYGETSILLSGDSTSVTEKIILESDGEVDSDILKVGHHGSRSSTSRNFVSAVSPAYALISAGQSNTYGHPHPEVLDTLAREGAQILRTDELGTIVFGCDRMGICKIKK